MTEPLEPPKGARRPAWATTEPGAIAFLDEFTDGFTEAEIYSLFSPGPPVDDDEGNLVAAATQEEHAGAMIALVPTLEDAERLALDGGESVDQLHVTLVYLGEAADIDDDARQALLDMIGQFTDEMVQPVEGNVFGLAVFNPLGEEPCLVALVGQGDGFPLDDIHNMAIDAAEEAGIDTSMSKRPWIPHGTLTYFVDEMNTEVLDSVNVNDLAGQRMGPIAFDRIRITFGGEVHDFTLSGTIVAAFPAFHLPGKHNQASHGKGGKAAVEHREKVATVGSALHENWRKTRRQEDGSYEPRVKKTTDKKYIAEHGTDQVDIANTKYEDLPSDWQAENKAAAEVAVKILDRNGGSVDLSDSSTRSEVGSEIHNEWLSRNSWAAGGDLDVPFDDLPLDEQLKDIEQIQIAMEVLGGSVTASIAFHLPGKHNQKDHGKGGTIRVADKKELKNNQKKFKEGSKKAKTGGAAMGEAESGMDEPAFRRLTGYSDTIEGQSTHRAINGGLAESQGDLDTFHAGSRSASKYGDAELRDDIVAIDGRMRPTTQDIIVERVVPVSSMGSSFSTTGGNDGLTYRTHGYTHTSAGGDNALGFEEVRLRGGMEEPPIDVVRLRILVPAGTPVLSNGSSFESEIVLPRSSSFQIVGDHGGSTYGPGMGYGTATRYSMDVVMLSD